MNTGHDHRSDPWSVAADRRMLVTVTFNLSGSPERGVGPSISSLVKRLQRFLEVSGDITAAGGLVQSGKFFLCFWFIRVRWRSVVTGMNPKY